MRHWSGKFQKLRNFRLKPRWYRLEQVHNFIGREGNLTLKISVLGVKTADTGRDGVLVIIKTLFES